MNESDSPAYQEAIRLLTRLEKGEAVIYEYLHPTDPKDRPKYKEAGVANDLWGRLLKRYEDHLIEHNLGTGPSKADIVI